MPLLVLGIAAGAAVGLLLGGSQTGDGSHPERGARPAVSDSPAQRGWPFHRRVPAIRLRTADGRSLSLRSLRGKVVVLAPSLTLCHEICPMTTQAFIAMRRTLLHDGLAGRVAFVEATVDPWRDSPARLRAYADMTGIDFTQMTGSMARIRRFWDFFGVGFKKVPQGHPPDVDWWTHRPERFDVEHVDGVFLIDQKGYERVFYPGIANVAGHLKPALKRLLSRDGLKNLAHPASAWTEPQLMAGIGRLLGVRIPQAQPPTQRSHRT